MVKASTSKQAWLDAAYATFRSEGLAAVRVEPLARSLGATKGSFYWHFHDRAELVALEPITPDEEERGSGTAG